MNIGIKNTVSTNLSGIEQGAMNSLREKRRGGGGRESRFRARDKPESLAYGETFGSKCSFPSNALSLPLRTPVTHGMQ